MGKQIYRSRENKVIAGVCGGFAEFFNIDPTIVRILWVAISLTFGAGVIAYIIAAAVMPKRQPGSYNNTYKYDDDSNFNFNSDMEDWKDKPNFDSEKSRHIVGIGLIFIGAMFLIKQFFHWFDFKWFWPLLLIGIGGLIIYRGGRDSV